MIKIKLLEYNLHRNETTFRYYLENQDLFREVGIDFTTSNDYDIAFVGQASIIDKKLSIDESIDKGLDFVSKIKGDYIIVDGQDSTTLMGTIDVFRESSAKLFLKTVYLNDFSLYKKGWVNGRIYWGEGDYSVKDIDDLKFDDYEFSPNESKILLSTQTESIYRYSKKSNYYISLIFYIISIFYKSKFGNSSWIIWHIVGE